ncbi:hypothetical protein GCM10028807_16820 [Spirosoma daeguense]
MTTSPPQIEPPASRQSFWKIQFLYLAVSSLLLGGMIWLPKNQKWLSETVGRFYDQHQKLANKTDIAVRRQEGYKSYYSYIELIQNRCKPNDYFLIPPQAYMIRNAYQQGKATGYSWLYPSVLYYHLGKSVKLIDMTAPDSLLQQATHTFWVYDNKIFLLTFKDHNRPLVLGEFKKYNPKFFAYTPKQAQAFYKTKP